MDLSVKSVSRFHQSFCVKQLMDNLRVEQPGEEIISKQEIIGNFWVSGVTLGDIGELPRQFCFGKNISVPLSNQHFYVLESENKFERIDGRIDHNIVEALTKADPENVEAIDGGPNCFGDSGKMNK